MTSYLRAGLLAMALAYHHRWPMPMQSSTIPEEPSAAAVAFVGQFSDAHLAGIVQRMGARHPTLTALSQLHGQMLAVMFEAEVSESRRKVWARLAK